MFKIMLYKIIFFSLITPTFANWTPLIATEMASATMQKEEVDEKVPRSECEECNGTGKVKAGDGQTIVWRKCDNCYDDGEDQGAIQQDQFSALVVSADWCAPCRQLKAGPIRRLKSKGYKIDVKDYNKVGRKYGVRSLPTIIFFKNGKEVKRLTGYRKDSIIEQYLKPQAQTQRLTPSQLRAWCKTYQGQPHYVQGMTYKQHLMDPRATLHEGGPFEAWQLRGLTTSELIKIHGGQHTGKLTPYGTPP